MGPGPAGRLAPVLVMPVALVLIVLGLFSRNVTAVGGERLVRSGLLHCPKPGPN
ncbi:hypothetical protein [Pelomicrobium sp. G1]|uniref:hypothetical protein n=1 Tax=unclassified Pelomicrobium TaxID=2815318 RepID=UPI003F76B66A